MKYRIVELFDNFECTKTCFKVEYYNSFSTKWSVVYGTKHKTKENAKKHIDRLVSVDKETEKQKKLRDSNRVRYKLMKPEEYP